MPRLLMVQRLGGVLRQSPQEMAVPALTVLGGLACAAAVVYWGLRIVAAAPVAKPVEAPVAAAAAPAGEGAGLFGAKPTQAEGLKVTVGGVIRADGDAGAAVLAVAGGAPRLVHAGKEAAPGVVLSEVKARSVVLRQHGVDREIAMPPKAAVLKLAAVDATAGAPALVTNVPRANR